MSVNWSDPRRRPDREGWWTRVYDPRTRKQAWKKLRGARTARQARQELQQMIREGRASARSTPFREALEDWRLLRFATLCEGTRRNYQTVFSRWLAEWGTRPVASIGVREVERYHARLAESGTGPRTLNTERTLLRAFFSWAIERGIAIENPARTLRRLDDKPLDPGRVLDVDEIRRLLDACREPYKPRCSGFRNAGGRAGGSVTDQPTDWSQTHTPPSWLHPLVFVGTTTLLRLGTLRVLRWSHVDFTKSTLRVPGELLKTREGLEVHLDESTADLLREMYEKDVSPAKTPSMFVFPNIPDSVAISRAVSRAAKRAGIQGRVGFHALRRSGATILLRAGTPLEVVQRMGGWKSPEVLLKHYRKVDPSECRNARAYLAKVVSGSENR